MNDIAKTADALIRQRISETARRKAVDAGTYYGGVYDQNGQMVGAIQGGAEYGFYAPTISAFGDVIPPYIPIAIPRRFRAGGFVAYAVTPPGDPPARAAFDIQIAAAGEPPDGTWTSIFQNSEAAEALPYMAGEDRFLATDNAPALKTEDGMYAPLLYPVSVPDHIKNAAVSIRFGWVMRCVLAKVDDEDAEDAFGALAGITFKVVLDAIE